MAKEPFTRSRNGQNNYFIFVKANLVAYCEGGNPLSKLDILSGKSNSSAEDLIFWESVFRAFFPKLKVHFKPIGDCKNVSSMADNIISNNLMNTIALMDRDWNDYSENMKIDSRIIYTYGYAWENDVITSDIVANVIRLMCQCSSSDLPNHKAEFEAAVAEFVRQSWILLHLQLQSKNCDCGLCPTDPNFGGALSAFEQSGMVNRKAIARRFVNHKAKYVRVRRVHTKITRGIRHFPGHALMGLATKFVSRKAKMYGKLNFHSRDIIAHMLSVFSVSITTNLPPAVGSYYLDKIGLATHAASNQL